MLDLLALPAIVLLVEIIGESFSFLFFTLLCVVEKWGLGSRPCDFGPMHRKQLVFDVSVDLLKFDCVRLTRIYFTMIEQSQQIVDARVQLFSVTPIQILNAHLEFHLLHERVMQFYGS